MNDITQIERARILHEKPLSGEYEELLFGDNHSNTLWVCFSDITASIEWIGKFGCGSSSDSYVERINASNHFMVSAGGNAYVVDAAHKQIINQYLDNHTQAITYDGRRNLFIVADYVRIRLVSPSEIIWVSPRIALDGIRNLQLEGDVVRGMATTGFNGEEEEFSLNLETRQVICKKDFSSWDIEEETPLIIEQPWWKRLIPWK